jgi:hypothetical protein
MENINEQLNKLIHEVISLKQKIQFKETTLIDQFFLANRDKLKERSSENILIVISQHQREWSKNSLIYNGHTFHFSFLKRNCNIRSDLMYNILKNSDDKMFII